jgi:hypothetical protein
MRPQNWPELLAEFLATREAMPFAWVTNDCATFASEWIYRLTDVRIFEPTYTNEFGAYRFIESEGGMQMAATKRLGEPDNVGHRGDVALIYNRGRESLGVIGGAKVAAPGEDFMLMLPRGLILCSWNIDRDE